MILPGLFLLIDIGLFSQGFCGLFFCRLRGAIAPEMLPLAAWVPTATPVPPVIPSLSGLLLRCRGLRSSCWLAAGCLLWLI